MDANRHELRENDIVGYADRNTDVEFQVMTIRNGSAVLTPLVQMGPKGMVFSGSLNAVPTTELIFLRHSDL